VTFLDLSICNTTLVYYSIFDVYFSGIILLLQIPSLLTKNTNLATKFHQMTVDVTRMLLTASAVLDQDIEVSKRSIKSGLRLLLESTRIEDPTWLLDAECASAYQGQFKLRVHLIGMLIYHKSCAIGSTILQTAKDIVDICEITDIPINLDTYTGMMHSLGHMMSHFLLARYDQVSKELEEIINYEDKIFIESFVAIAGYFLQPGHSKNLLRVLLSVLNANTVIILRRELSKLPHVMDTSTPDTQRTFTNVALECVEQIQAPFSLQALARLTIRRGLASGILDDDSLASDALPVHMKAYVLHQE